MSDFARRCEMLKELGVEYWIDKEMRGPVGPERKYYDIDLFKQIRPPFDAQTWVSLCTNEGDYYIGGCCGTMSALQDKMEYWFRFENMYLKTRELEEAAGYWANHPDGAGLWNIEPNLTLEDFFTFAKENWKSLGPWDKLGAIWQIVKDYHYKGVDLPRASSPVYSDFERAIFVVDNLGAALSWARHSKDDPNKAGFDANQKLTLNGLLPAINTVYNTLQEMLKDEKPFNGFALIDLEHNGGKEVSTGRLGLSLYATLEDANKALDDQQEYENKYEELRSDIRGKLVRDRFGIRPVHITLARGLEFTGELINDNPTNKD